MFCANIETSPLIEMADRLLAVVEALEEEEDEIFVYMGGDQVVPQRVRRARIHNSVKIVRRKVV